MKSCRSCWMQHALDKLLSIRSIAYDALDVNEATEFDDISEEVLL